MAVLDSEMPDLYQIHPSEVRVSWLIRRRLFDFERIDIRQVADEAVERFVVQVGNDTDPLRQTRYPQLSCIVSPSCNLSDNTLRILRRTFGQVTVG